MPTTTEEGEKSCKTNSQNRSCTVSPRRPSRSPRPVPANAAEKFIFANPMNTDHVFHAISERFMAALADESGISIEYHPGGDLGDWVSLFEQSMQGVVPMTLTWASSDFDKRLDLIYLGYIVSNWEDAKKLYGPGAGMLDVYNDMLGDLGLHAVGIIPTDFGSVVIRKGVGESFR